MNPYRFIQDQYWNQVVLLALMNGVDGGTTITDNSKYNRALFGIGGARTRTAVKFEGTASLSHEGNAPAWDVSTDYSFAAGTAFTWEMYFRCNSSYPSFGFIMARSQGSTANRWAFAIQSSKLVIFHNGSAVVGGATNVPLNQWNHICYAREASGTARFFLNGTVDGTNSDGRNYTAANRLTLFADQSSASGLFGATYIDMLRITQACRYTANFTPPAVYPLSGG